MSNFVPSPVVVVHLTLSTPTFKLSAQNESDLIHLTTHTMLSNDRNTPITIDIRNTFLAEVSFLYFSFIDTVTGDQVLCDSEEECGDPVGHIRDTDLLELRPGQEVESVGVMEAFWPPLNRLRAGREYRVSLIEREVGWWCKPKEGVVGGDGGGMEKAGSLVLRAENEVVVRVVA